MAYNTSLAQLLYDEAGGGADERGEFNWTATLLPKIFFSGVRWPREPWPSAWRGPATRCSDSQAGSRAMAVAVVRNQRFRRQRARCAWWSGDGEWA